MFVELTHWGRLTHLCVDDITIIGSDNGLSSARRQAIIWTNAGILLIEPLRTNFSEISIKIHIFSFKKMYLKMSSGNWQPSCPGLNVLKRWTTRSANLRLVLMWKCSQSLSERAKHPGPPSPPKKDIHLPQPHPPPWPQNHTPIFTEWFLYHAIMSDLSWIFRANPE